VQLALYSLGKTKANSLEICQMLLPCWRTEEDFFTTISL